MFNAIARIIQIGLGVGLGIVLGNKVIKSTTKESVVNNNNDDNIFCKVKEKIHKMTSPNNSNTEKQTKKQ